MATDHCANIAANHSTPARGGVCPGFPRLKPGLTDDVQKWAWLILLIFPHQEGITGSQAEINSTALS